MWHGNGRSWPITVRARLAQAHAAGEVVTLHPASIERYIADIERLADLAAAHADLTESAELIATLRRL